MDVNKAALEALERLGILDKFQEAVAAETETINEAATAAIEKIEEEQVRALAEAPEKVMKGLLKPSKKASKGKIIFMETSKKEHSSSKGQQLSKRIQEIALSFPVGKSFKAADILERISEKPFPPSLRTKVSFQLRKLTQRGELIKHSPIHNVFGTYYEREET